jgi:hypothetical protein
MYRGICHRRIVREEDGVSESESCPSEQRVISFSSLIAGKKSVRTEYGVQRTIIRRPSQKGGSLRSALVNLSGGTGSLWPSSLIGVAAFILEGHPEGG